DGDIDALPVQVVEVGGAVEAAGDGVAEGASPGRIGDAGPNGISRLHQPADIVSERPIQVALPQIGRLHDVPVSIDDLEAVAHVFALLLLEREMPVEVPVTQAPQSLPLRPANLDGQGAALRPWYW